MINLNLLHLEIWWIWWIEFDDLIWTDLDHRWETRFVGLRNGSATCDSRNVEAISRMGRKHMRSKNNQNSCRYFQIMGGPDMIAGSESERVFLLICILSPSNFQSTLFVFHDLGNHNHQNHLDDFRLVPNELCAILCASIFWTSFCNFGSWALFGRSWGSLPFEAPWLLGRNSLWLKEKEMVENLGKPMCIPMITNVC